MAHTTPRGRKKKDDDASREMVPLLTIFIRRDVLASLGGANAVLRGGGDDPGQGGDLRGGGDDPGQGGDLRGGGDDPGQGGDLRGGGRAKRKARSRKK